MLEAISSPQIPPATVNKISGTSSNIYIKLKLKDKMILAMVDTGSIKNCMSYQTFISIFNESDLSTSNQRFKTATGSSIIVHGDLKTTVFIDDMECNLNVTICDINESLILGSEFLNEVSAIINYKSLLLKGDNFSTPIYGTSNSSKTFNVTNIQDEEFSSKSTLLCKIKGNDCKLPATFVYTPNPEIWGRNITPSVVNITDRVFEIDVQGITDPSASNSYEFQISKDTVIGTLQALSVNTIQEDLETWNLSPDERLELLVKQVKLNENLNLTDDEKCLVRDLLKEYHSIFSLSRKEMSFCTIYTHELKLKTQDVIQCPHRPIPIHQVDQVTSLIDELEQMGVIEKCNSQYRSPFMLVSKKDKSKRLVIDYRAINALCQPILYPMPDLESTRALCGSADYYSVFDLKSAFWQIPITENSKPSTSFWVSNKGCYQFRVCPQGHCQSPSALQALTDIMFGDIKGKSIITYGDDCIIPAKDVQEMLERLRIMFDRVKAANILIQGTKSEIFKKSVKYLGHIMDKHGISADMHRIQDLLAIKMPKSKKEMQSFLGLCCFWRKFIKDFAEISQPLTESLKLENYEVNDEMNKSFDLFKEKLASPPTLCWPNLSEGLSLWTDASLKTIGHQ